MTRTHEPPQTKDAILARNREAAQALDAVLSRLSDERLLAPGAVGDWSLKDTLAHLSSSWLAGQLEALADGRAPTAVECFGDDAVPGPNVDMSTNDGRNAWRHAIERDLAPDAVRERYRRFVERTRAAIERMPEPEFAVSYALEPLAHVGRMRPAREGEQGFPLWRWIAGNQWHHIEDHLRDFEAGAT